MRIRSETENRSHLRLAMVTSSYLPSLGGVETHVDEVARRMVTRGVEVTVLTTDVSGCLPRYERRNGLTVRRFSAYPRRTDLSLSLPLARALSDGPYDLVHLQGVHTLLAPMALRAAQRAGLPTVVTFHTGGHSSGLRTAARGTQWRALRGLLRRADALIAVCRHEVDLFARRLAVEHETIRMIRNGAEALPGAGECADLAGAPLVCSIGRLERYKGHHRIIRAMPALLEISPEARLVVVGRGRYESQLRRLSARLGVDHAVTFTSYDSTQRPALGALVRSCDVVALLSDYEANPVALMEALALGKNVVVASAPGLDELACAGLATAVARKVGPEVLAAVLARVAARVPAPPAVLPTWDDCADDILGVYSEVWARRQMRSTWLTTGPTEASELGIGLDSSWRRSGAGAGSNPLRDARNPDPSYMRNGSPSGEPPPQTPRRTLQKGRQSG